jgi:hypothetical protein
MSDITPAQAHDRKRLEVLDSLLERVESRGANSSAAVRFACAYAALAGTLTDYGDAKT